MHKSQVMINGIRVEIEELTKEVSLLDNWCWISFSKEDTSLVLVREDNRNQELLKDIQEVIKKHRSIKEKEIQKNKDKLKKIINFIESLEEEQCK